MVLSVVGLVPRAPAPEGWDKDITQRQAERKYNRHHVVTRSMKVPKSARVFQCVYVCCVLCEIFYPNPPGPGDEDKCGTDTNNLPEGREEARTGEVKSTEYSEVLIVVVMQPNWDSGDG